MTKMKHIKRNYPCYGSVKTRKFGDNIFEWVKDYHKKSDAIKDAELIRRMGHRARIIKEKGLNNTKYAIYYAPKYKRIKR